MRTDAEWISESLEIAAEYVDDLSPCVYQRFFAVMPEARELFGGDCDRSLQGRMLNAILLTILDQAAGRLNRAHVQTWAMDHRMWEVSAGMFPAMLNGLQDAVRESVGTRWMGGHQEAWERQVSQLLETIDQGYGAAVPALG